MPKHLCVSRSACLTCCFYWHQKQLSLVLAGNDCRWSSSFEQLPKLSDKATDAGMIDIKFNDDEEAMQPRNHHEPQLSKSRRRLDRLLDKEANQRECSSTTFRCMFCPVWVNIRPNWTLKSMSCGSYIQSMSDDTVHKVHEGVICWRQIGIVILALNTPLCYYGFASSCGS